MICRLQVPHALEIPGVRQLAERACIECGIPPKEGVDHIASLCGHWTSVVLLGMEENEPVGMVIVELPNPFMLRPLLSLAYNHGSMQVGQELFTAARAYVTGAGYDKIDMLNRSRADTDVWAHGAEIRLRGKEVKRTSMITLELNQDEWGSE